MEKIPQKRMECFGQLFDHLAWIEHQFLRGIRDSRKAGSLRDDKRCGRSREVNRPDLMGQSVRVSLPKVQTFLPVTFGYSPSSEVVVMKQLRRWKRLWRRSLTRSHKRTSIGPSRSCWNGTSALQPVEITSKGTRVSCVYYQ